MFLLFWICPNVFSFIICFCLGGSPRGTGTAQPTYDYPPPSLSARGALEQPLWTPLGRHLGHFGAPWKDIQRENLKNGHLWSLHLDSEGLSLQRKLHFHHLQGSHFGYHFESILDPQNGLRAP